MPPKGSKQPDTPPYRATAYSYYVLFVLFVVYVLNFADRNILSILGEDIKRDLGISDAQLGFLYGTAFAVFYALFGIPLGKLADLWLRGRLISLGLALWSTMTALSGFAGNFAQLALARIGVGVGEASASPAAFSMLGDYFPREQRGFALAVYSSGIYVGGGLALAVGGEVVEWWRAAYPDGDAPFGLRGWQVAFIVVGLPGLLLALICAFIKEPFRGQSEGIFAPDDPEPFKKAWQELLSVLPITSWLSLRAKGASAKTLGLNIALAVGLCVFAAAMVFFFAGKSSWVSDAQQWGAIGLGVYCVFSWAQGLVLRDPPSYALIWGNPTFVLAAIAFGTISTVGYSVALWTPIYALRELSLPLDQVGWVLGFGSAFAGWLGISLGGPLADAWRRKTPRGRLFLIMTATCAALPLGLATFTVTDTNLFYALAITTNVFSTMWVGAAAATCQDLVLPRMRGVATAAYFLATTLLGLGLGPYMVGKLSVETGSLRTAILLLFLIVPVTLTLLGLAAKRLPGAEASRIERAKAAGEEIDDADLIAGGASETL
ncbi:MAG: MFS transporter [Pseudomonadota bacterium]